MADLVFGVKRDFHATLWAKQMNLYFRLIWTLFFSSFQSRVSVFEDYETRHYVFPNDLDALGHMNNGRFFTITDFVRVGWLIRAKIWQVMKRKKLYPVIAGETAQFRKPLMPFQKYKIRTRLRGWDEHFFYIEHAFISKKGIHALVLIRTMIIGKSRLSPLEILNFVEQDVPPIKMDEVLEFWNKSSADHWGEVKH